jgi:hypothetical protein
VRADLALAPTGPRGALLAARRGWAPAGPLRGVACSRRKGAVGSSTSLAVCKVRSPYVSEIEIGGKREDGGTIEADSLEAGGGAVRVLRKGRLPLTVTSLRGNC